MVLYDKYGRPVRGARISINSSTTCNFNCFFCHKEGIFYNSNRLMTPKEIGRIVRLLYKFGVRYVKLTGGEPMLRNDILEIIDEIKMAGIEEISMTTNGTRIVEMAYDLKKHGLNRINISVHSLRRSRYHFITGVDRLYYTLKAVEKAVDVGLRPVKLNIVVLKNINDDELDDFINYSHELGGYETNIIQLIELLDIDKKLFNVYHVDLSTIENRIRNIAIDTKYRRIQNRPIYILKNNVAIEFVKPVNNPFFCMGNERRRITYDGKFKPCLMRNDNLVDFLDAMRNGATDKELAALYLKAVLFREPFYKKDYTSHREPQPSDECMI